MDKKDFLILMLPIFFTMVVGVTFFKNTRTGIVLVTTSSVVIFFCVFMFTLTLTSTSH